MKRSLNESPRVYARLQAVSARPPLKLASVILAQYIGIYQLDPEVEIKASAESGHLVARGRDNTKFVLQAETENDFYVPGQYLVAHFKKAEMGGIAGFQLERFSGTPFVKERQLNSNRLCESTYQNR